VRDVATAAVLVLAVSSAGCAALAASGTFAAAKAAAGSAIASGAAPAALGVGVGIGVSATGAADPQSPETALVGMSRANAEACAGFHGRVSESLPDGKELWTYDRRTCRVSISFKEGYVTEVNSSGSSDCNGILNQCRARQR
jgi:hypothetical protein